MQRRPPRHRRADGQTLERVENRGGWDGMGDGGGGSSVAFGGGVSGARGNDVSREKS